MYNSIKPWINLPATRKPYIKRDGTGEKVFSADISFMCYAEGKVSVVTNKEGKEVVSNKRLYIEGTTEMSELDRISFEGRESDIKAISYFYRNGSIDIKVVYL